MTRYDFSKVELPGQKSGKCSVCGKRCKRQKTFYQTINPFNKNVAGHQKNVVEIQAELREDRDYWKKQPLVCATCENES